MLVFILCKISISEGSKKCQKDNEKVLHKNSMYVIIIRIVIIVNIRNIIDYIIDAYTNFGNSEITIFYWLCEIIKKKFLKNYEKISQKRRV